MKILNSKIFRYVAGAAAALALLGGSFAIGFNVKPTTEVRKASQSIELSQEQKPATVIENGVEKQVSVPTVESVDAELSIHEGQQGMGWAVRTESPDAFRDDVLGKCVNLDGYAGAQCWDGMALFMENYAGRTFDTCGTGAAKGTIQDGCWQKNAGNEFEMIWDASQLQPGDIGVWKTGTWGHTGMIMGYPNNGYVTLLGQNQGGGSCEGGGAAFNIINISLKDFVGAFRPKSYIKVEPAQPELPLPISNCVKWHVLRGDTMSKIMLECENTVQYGEAMNAYARTWYSLIVKPGQSVYDGWVSPSHVGLYENDDIEHRL